MRAILWKELRWSAGWATLSFLFAAVWFVWALSLPNNPSVLLDRMFTSGAFIFPMIGLLRGLTQVSLENRGDRWAFLTHRPITRTTLFFGKTIAGLTLYFIAAGLPLAAALAWIAVPRHFPAPFDWRMALPGIADLVCGAGFYFAGMLIGMRDARWYGSRTVGIGVPIICSFAAGFASEFWLAIIWGVAGILITGAAALGTFMTGGGFETQRPLLRAATGVAVGSGLALTLSVVTVAVSIFFFGPGHMESKSYRLATDGTVVITRQQLGKVLDVTGLEGRPIPKYQDFDAKERFASSFPGVGLPLRPGDDETYRDVSRFFFQIFSRSQIRPTWYFVRRLGLFAEYDNESGEVLGWLGPDGPSPGETMPARRFTRDPRPQYPWRFYAAVLPLSAPLFVSSDSVYRIDVLQPNVEKLFAAAPGESIIGAAQPPNMDYIAISTTRRIIVTDADGNIRQAVMNPEVAGNVVVSPADHETYLWYYPAFSLSDRVSTSPIVITRFGMDGAIESQQRLPFQTVLVPPAWNRVFLPWAVAPVTVPAAVSFISGEINVHSPDFLLGTSFSGNASAVTGAESYSQSQLAVVGTLSGLASIVPAMFAYRRGRKYAFSRGRLAVWTALSFVLGPVGFLLMICLLDWPAHETCPSCSHLRVVNRELCEFCGAPFSLPRSDGTEILDFASEVSS